MVARAQGKARRAGLAIDFRVAGAQTLPFPEARFDVVLSTLMLHHLPRSSRQQLVREARRVLKPGGRFFAVDFTVSARGPGFHRHGHVDMEEIMGLIRGAAFEIVASGPVAYRNLSFVLAATHADGK